MATGCPTGLPHSRLPGRRAVGALAADRSPRRSVAARHTDCSLRCPTRNCLPLVQLPAQPSGCPIRIRWPRRKSQHSRASRGTSCRRNSERLPSPARKRCHRTQATRFRLRPASQRLHHSSHRVSRIRERTPSTTRPVSLPQVVPLSADLLSSMRVGQVGMASFISPRLVTCRRMVPSPPVAGATGALKRP
jgi:hypothetical protein